jgi:hypothetical protein
MPHISSAAFLRRLSVYQEHRARCGSGIKGKLQRKAFNRKETPRSQKKIAEKNSRPKAAES